MIKDKKVNYKTNNTKYYQYPTNVNSLALITATKVN
jgi:hypothetical protein